MEWFDVVFWVLLLVTAIVQSIVLWFAIRTPLTMRHWLRNNPPPAIPPVPMPSFGKGFVIEDESGNQSERQ